MIIPVKKYLILGAKRDLEVFFNRAQEEGVIEFIPPLARKFVEIPAEVQHLVDAIRILRKLPPKEPYYDASLDLKAADEYARRIIDLKSEVEKCAEEKRLVEAEIQRVAPFGDFSIDDIDYIETQGKREIQFFCMKSDKAKIARFPDEIIYINTEYDLDYFIAINPELKSYPGMIEMRIDRPLGELRTHHIFVKESLHQLEAELKGFAEYLHFLQNALTQRLNDYHLFHAKKDVSRPMSALFAVEGWIPENKTHLLGSIAEGLAILYEPIAMDPEERMPTYMENKGVSAIGEDIVRVYETPSPTDKDPSGWVFWFFCLFCAMIVSDAGYGLIFLASALCAKYKLRKIKPAQARILKLIIYLASTCIIWGVCTSAYFGIPISPKNPLGKVSVLQFLAKKKAEYHIQQHDDVYEYWVQKYPALATASNGTHFVEQAVTPKGEFEALDTFADNIMLEFALFIGVIHLAISLLRYFPRHFAGLGWVAFMIGGYLYFPSMLHATSFLNFLNIISKETASAVGLQMIYGGIAAALLLALIQKRLKGLSEISLLVQVFADVLSYLRLYALALAGASLAATFNEMGRNVGLFFGWIIILCGHGVNILLCSMAVVVHGLRLNFIEWYHYCFEGGGRMLRPLKRIKIYKE